ncbi:MAG: hypothetical protein R2880_02205 [Deinococcales bacterium]
MLLEADTPVVTIFGKTWDLHVTEALGATLEQNLAMIEDSIAFLVAQGKMVIYDAEHFFDGYKANPDYALKTLEAAVKGGASRLVLCDTNGGSLPDMVATRVAEIKERFTVPVGVHTHNDGELVPANSLAEGRRKPRARNHERLWGALWQCQPHQHHRQFIFENGL